MQPLFLDPYKPTRMTHGKYIISGFFFFVAKIDFSKISVILESPFFFTKKTTTFTEVEALHQKKITRKKQ